MKVKLVLILFFICLAGFSFSQKKTKILIKNITYDVKINNDCSVGSNWYDNNIEKSARSVFQEMIFNKVSDSTITVYDDKGTPLSEKDIQKILTLAGADTVTMQRTYPYYDYFDTIVQRKVKPTMITYLRFHEVWYYDAKTYKIEKEIIEYAPCITTGTKKITPLFWIKTTNTKSSKGYTNLTENISYAIPLIRMESSEITNVIISIDTSRTLMKDFFLKLTQGILKNKIKVFHPFYFEYYYKNPAYQVLLKNAVNKIASDSTNTNVYIHFPNEWDSSKYFDTQFSQRDMIFMRTYEKWMINPVTMQIKKEIIALAPCFPNFDILNNKWTTINYFVILYDKPWIKL